MQEEADILEAQQRAQLLKTVGQMTAPSAADLAAYSVSLEDTDLDLDAFNAARDTKLQALFARCRAELGDAFAEVYR